MNKLTKITFYGSSDDNFCWKGTGIADEIGCFNSIPMVRVIDSDGNSLFVVGHYAPNGHAGTWSIGIAPYEEDQPLPMWDFGFDMSGYSTMLTITGPGLAIQQWNEDEQLWEEA